MSDLQIFDTHINIHPSREAGTFVVKTVPNPNYPVDLGFHPRTLALNLRGINIVRLSRLPSSVYAPEGQMSLYAGRFPLGNIVYNDDGGLVTDLQYLMRRSVGGIPNFNSAGIEFGENGLLGVTYEDGRLILDPTLLEGDVWTGRVRRSVDILTPNPTPQLLVLQSIAGRTIKGGMTISSSQGHYNLGVEFVPADNQFSYLVDGISPPIKWK